MISLNAVVNLILYLVVAGLIFGLLFGLVVYCEKQYPRVAPFAGVAKIILAILGVLVIIGVLLSLVSGHSIIVP